MLDITYKIAYSTILNFSRAGISGGISPQYIRPKYTNNLLAYFRINSPPSFPFALVEPEAGGDAGWLSKWEVFQHFENFAKLEMFFYLLLKIPHIYWLGVKKRSSSPFLDSHVFIFKTIMRQWHLVVGTPSLDCLFPHNTLSPFHFTLIPSWNCYNH